VNVRTAEPIAPLTNNLFIQGGVMHTRRTNIRGIIFRDGELLVTKFKQDDGSESDHWGTFGGGLDIGESITDGLHREMIEETGIAPEIGKLLFIQQFDDGEKEHCELFFHIKNHQDYEAVDLEATTHGALEMTRSAFVDPAKENVLPAFLQTIDIQAYINDEKEVFLYSELSK